MREIKSILAETQVTALLLMAAGLVLTVILGKRFFAYGLVVGTFLGLFNFRLLARNAVVFTGLRKENARRYILFTYLFRFALMGIVLSLCILKDIAMFAGAACGLLLLQAAIFINNLLIFAHPLEKPRDRARGDSAYKK